jgi:hypothetical protein
MRIAAAGLIAGSLLFAGAARADENVETKSYAVETLVADGVSVATIAAGVAVGNDAGSAVSAIGIAGYAIATPIIHGIHGSWGRAGGSLAMRVIGIPVATLVGMLGGFATCPKGPTDEAGAAMGHGIACGAVGGLVGAGIGALIVTSIDASMLAKEEVRKPSGVSLTPTFDASSRGASVGVGGTF